MNLICFRELLEYKEIKQRMNQPTIQIDTRFLLMISRECDVKSVINHCDQKTQNDRMTTGQKRLPIDGGGQSNRRNDRRKRQRKSLPINLWRAINHS